MNRFTVLGIAVLMLSAVAIAVFAQQDADPGSQLRELSFEEERQVVSKLVSWLPLARSEARIDAAVERYTGDLESGGAEEIRYRFQELVRETNPRYLLDLLVGFVEDREVLRMAASGRDLRSRGRASGPNELGGSSGLGVAVAGISDGGNIGTGGCQYGQEKNQFGICVDPCPPGHKRSSNGLTCDQSGPPSPCAPGWELQPDGSCAPSGLPSLNCPSGQVVNSLTGQCEGLDLGSGGTPSLCPVLEELYRSCNETYALNCQSANPKFSSEECRELSAQCELYAEDMTKEGCD